MNSYFPVAAILSCFVYAGRAIDPIDTNMEMDMTNPSGLLHAIPNFGTGNEQYMTEFNNSESEQQFNNWYAVISLILCGVGAIANLVVIFILLVLKEYRKKTTDLIVLQLAVADLLYLTELPLKAVTVLQPNDEWPFSQALCQFHQVLNQLSSYVSIMLIVLMSIDRYFAICHSFVPGKKLTCRTVAWASVLIWVLALLMSVPVMTVVTMNVKCQCSLKGKEFMSEIPLEENGRPAYCNIPHTSLAQGQYIPDITSNLTESDHAEFNISNYEGLVGEYGDYGDYYDYSEFETKSEADKINEGLQCNYFDASATVRAIYFFDCIGMYFLPALVLILAYSFILREVVSSKRDLSQLGNRGSPTRKLTVAQRTTYTCTALVACFLVCWLPDNVYVISRFSGLPLDSSDCRKARYICNLMGYISPVLNPLLYTFMGISFKNRFSSAWTKVSSRIQSKSSGSSSYYNGTMKRSTNQQNTTRAAAPVHTISSNMSNNNNNNCKNYNNNNVLIYKMRC